MVVTTRFDLNSNACVSLIVLFFLLLFSPGREGFHSAVRFLPGFQGSLPFKLETGYVGVDESEDVQLFYYFVGSENDPKRDPLLLWLTGGPGCSSFSGLAYEIGPLNFKTVEYNGSLPTLVLNSNSWTKVASIIFVDLPVGTGFSYARTSRASQSGDLRASQQADEFLRMWLNDHPDFLNNSVYVGGDSYSGITVPLVTQLMLDGDEAGMKPRINLKGYLLGNPVTSSVVEENSKIPFAHGMGLISDELYESMKKSCRGEYTNIDPRNSKCVEDVLTFYKCLAGIQTAHILEHFCAFASPRPFEISNRRSLNSGDQLLLGPEQPLPQIGCRTYGYLLSHYWVNNDSVRDALHVRKGTTGEWQRCNYGLPFTRDISDSVQYHSNLSTRGLRSLIYSGDHDMIVPFLGTQAWIRSLRYAIAEDWRPWMVAGQVGGYTRTYANRMTFATVKGGGHTAPEYKPRECLALFKRWISGNPL